MRAAGVMVRTAECYAPDTLIEHGELKTLCLVIWLDVGEARLAVTRTL